MVQETWTIRVLAKVSLLREVTATVGRVRNREAADMKVAAVDIPKRFFERT